LKNSDAYYLLPNLFSSLAPCFRTLWAYGFGKSHPEGFGLDGLTEQSAEL